LNSTHETQLKVYVVEGKVTNYRDAIEALETLSPLEDIRSFSFHVSNNNDQCDKPNTVSIIRPLGARPSVYVMEHSFYNSFSLANTMLYSLVATLQLTPDPDDLLICVLNECEIETIDVEVGQSLPIDRYCYYESIPLRSKTALPWKRITDALTL